MSLRDFMGEDSNLPEILGIVLGTALVVFGMMLLGQLAMRH